MRIYFVLIAVLIFVPKEDGVILTYPQNKAVVSGDQIKLECASDSTNGLQWQFLPFGSTVSLTVIIGCVLNPAYNTTYSVEIIDAGSCNIVVFKASVNEVGTYTCVPGFDLQQQAQLVVVDSKPNCTVLLNGGNTADLVAGETTTMICTVRYSTNLSPPAAKWTDPQDQLVPGLPTGLPMDGNFYSYINIMANRSDIQPYSIMIYFLPPNNTTSGAASNAPSYTYNWTSDVIEVLYPASQPIVNLSLLSSITVCTALNLTCFSDSKPPATYQWANSPYGDVTNGNTIIGEYGDSYMCTATNTVRGMNYSNSTAFTAYIAPPSNKTSCKFPHSSNMTINNDTRDVGDYSCSNRSSTVNLTCYVDTVPLATYEWILPNGQQLLTTETIKASENGIYICKACVNISSESYCANKSVNVSDCSTSQSSTTELTTITYVFTGNNSEATPSPTSSPTTSTTNKNTYGGPCVSGCIVGIVAAVVYECLNVVLMGVFLGIYAFSGGGGGGGAKNSNRNNNNKITKKEKLNDQFPCLKKMLPCMNQPQKTECCWVVLFAVMTAIVGFFVFSGLLIWIFCCYERKRKESRNSSETNTSVRNTSGGEDIDVTILQYQKQTSKHPIVTTAAHGSNGPYLPDDQRMVDLCHLSKTSPTDQRPQTLLPPDGLHKVNSGRGHANPMYHAPSNKPKPKVKPKAEPNPDYPTENYSDQPHALMKPEDDLVYADLHLVHDPKIQPIQKIDERTGIYAELNRA